MSIWISKLLAELLPTTSGAATTRAAVVPLSAYAVELLETLPFLGAGLLLYLLIYGQRRQRWSPLRVADGRASLPLWVIGASMVWSFLAVPSLVALTLRGNAAATQPASDGLQVLTYSATCAMGLLLAAGLHFALRRARTAQMLGLTPLKEKLLPLQAFIAALIALPTTQIAGALSLLVWQILRVDHEPAHAMLQMMQRNETARFVLGLTIFNATLLAPIFEETLFRGHFQTALAAAMPRSRWPAILITSLLFAAIHEPWTAPAIFVLSVLIGIAYEWTGSLWVAIAIHASFNSVSTWEYLRGH